MQSPSRRNRSRQRERILARLRKTDSHPTAALLHAALLPEMPRLSLATVYRNLELLVEEGQALRLAVAGGPTRYDGNLDPHHHFRCERCDAILDLDLPVSGRTFGRLRREGLEPRSVRIDISGLCRTCSAEGRS
jgi:Fe2+ or Zn2+ uptake regulation protein